MLDVLQQSARQRSRQILKYEPLASVEPNHEEGGVACRPQRTFSRWSWILGVTIVAVLGLFVTLKVPAVAKPGEEVAWNQMPRPSYFRLLLYAPRATTPVCRTVVSTAALDYTPYLINWGNAEASPAPADGGSPVAKIHRALAKLQNLQPVNDNDMVVLTEGSDTWFQLRASTLLARFEGINARANVRIASQLGSDVSIRQLVVFGAQRDCSPSGACQVVVDSGLPTLLDDSPADTVVQRHYLNSGFAMGTVASMRALLLRAAEEAKADTSLISDQSIFTKLFDEQETARRASINVDAQAIRSGSNTSEFGIGLDYAGELFLATDFTNDDSIVWKTAKQSLAAGGISNVPADVFVSRPPFHTLRGTRFPSGVLPKHRDWAAVPLLSHAGVTPVSVHCSTDADTVHEQDRYDQWKEMWFQPWGRSLLDARSLEPIRAMAVLNDEYGLRREWWGTTKDNGWFDNGWLSTDSGSYLYEQICNGSNGAIWEEMFRDGRGPWRDPRLGWK